jgi:cation diffusion facilitator CzcD-associated flavoprotein CzcO
LSAEDILPLLKGNVKNGTGFARNRDGGSEMEDTELTGDERALMRSIASASVKDRVNRLQTAINHVRSAHAECRELRQLLPPSIRKKYGARLLVIETLCAFAVIDAEKAGVREAKKEVAVDTP